MPKRAKGVSKTKGRRKYPSPEVMQRVNSKLLGNRANADYNQYYDDPHVGDSIERRLSDYSVSNICKDIYKERGTYDRFGHGSASYAHVLKQLATDDEIFHRIIAQCMIGYIDHGILRVIIDLYANFATDGLQINHNNKSVQNFYRTWARRITLKERTNRFFSDTFISGIVFIYKIRAQLKIAEEREMKRSTSARNINSSTLIVSDGKKQKSISPDIDLEDNMVPFTKLKDEALKQVGKRSKSVKKDGGKKIPWEYISLSPLQMETRNKGVGSHENWVFVLNKDDKDAVGEYVEKLGKTKLKPSKYTGKNAGLYAAEIKMDSDDFHIIADTKFDNWSWAIPFIYPSLRHLGFKDYLRHMESKFARSVINSVTLWELGDPDKGIVPEDEHFERLADMLQQPGKAMNIIWPAPIKASVIEPRTANVLDPKKFDAVNADILTSLGVPDVLLGGKGSNFSNAYISITPILEKIQAARDKIEDWLLGELKEIADVMGFKKLPTIKWKRDSLRDKKAEQTFKLGLFDRGILSAEALLLEANEDLETEVARQRRERNITENDGVGILDKRGPYFRPEDLVKNGIMPYGWEKDVLKAPVSVDPSVDESGQPPGEKSTEDNINGRPPGKDDTKDRKEREPKPKGIEIAGSIVKFNVLKLKAIDLISQIEDVIKTKENLKGSVLENVVYSIISGISSKDGSDIIGDKISGYKNSKANIPNDLYIVYEYLKDYSALKEPSNKLTKNDRYGLFAHAWAVYNINN